MSAPMPRPFVPVDLNTEFVALERRMNTTEMRERGIGRGAWRPVLDMLGFAVHDGAIPGWRRLNDGRVEVRGRLAIPTSLAAGTAILHLPEECAPPGVSSVSSHAPCSANGTNPGMVRVDFAGAIGAGGARVTAVIAYPPTSQPLTEWIGLDHVMYDQNLYIDVLPTTEVGQRAVVPPHNLAVITRRGETYSVIPGTSPEPIPQPTQRPHHD